MYNYPQPQPLQMEFSKPLQLFSETDYVVGKDKRKRLDRESGKF